MAATSAEIVIDVPPPALFDIFIPIELPRILLGWGPLPAVVATEGQTGPWDKPGSSRTVRLADGSSAQEAVTACERPTLFRYHVKNFTNPLIGGLASGAMGEWRFTPEGAGTRVVWTYDYTARNALAAAPLALIVAFLWRPYMQVGLRETKRLAEQQAATS